MEAFGKQTLLKRHTVGDLQQLSRDKFERFPRATAEFTLCVLDG